MQKNELARVGRWRAKRWNLTASGRCFALSERASVECEACVAVRYNRGLQMPKYGSTITHLFPQRSSHHPERSLTIAAKTLTLTCQHPKDSCVAPRSRSPRLTLARLILREAVCNANCASIRTPGFASTHRPHPPHASSPGSWRQGQLHSSAHK